MTLGTFSSHKFIYPGKDFHHVLSKIYLKSWVPLKFINLMSIDFDVNFQHNVRCTLGARVHWKVGFLALSINFFHDLGKKLMLNLKKQVFRWTPGPRVHWSQHQNPNIKSIESRNVGLIFSFSLQSFSPWVPWKERQFPIRLVNLWPSMAHTPFKQKVEERSQVKRSEAEQPAKRQCSHYEKQIQKLPPGDLGLVKEPVGYFS